MLSLLILPFVSYVLAYSAVPRWGQAVVVIEDALFVHGGKVDQFNEQYYTTSPNTNDLLYLSLSNSFQVSNPPWELVASSSNMSTSQGPTLSWHTLSAFNISTVLLFGGQPGPNSPTVIVDNTDSAFLLNIFDHMNPRWISQPQDWLGEPPRRVYHSTVTLPDGRVLIIGGTKADGSGLTSPRNYLFDITRSMFAVLDTENGPVDIYGHVSLILPDGRVVVFGGVSTDAALPLSTIWILDTSQATWSWETVTIISDAVPTGRRAFAAAVLPDGKILIHGGADKDVQTTFSDGWILDLFDNPVTWTRIPLLDEIGPRHDHFAVAYGQQVIFGFGYGPSSPAPADIKVYDAVNSDFPAVFTPPPSPGPSYTPTTHATLPGATQTGSKPPEGSKSSNPVPTPIPTGRNNGNDSDSDKSRSKVTAIAVSTAFGVLSLIVVAAVALHYYRKKRREEEQHGLFRVLGDDNDESPQSARDIPPVRGYDEKPGIVDGVLASIGLRGKATSAYSERRDMLADEDTRQFGWSPYGNMPREATTGSSWSLRNLLSGVRGKTREPSSGQASTLSTPWREKHDPFLDGARLVEGSGFNDSSGLPPTDPRPQSRRGASYTSTRSYVDPFSDVDPPQVDPLSMPGVFGPTFPTEGHSLSPVVEQDSQHSLSIPSQSVSSLGHPPSIITSATSLAHESSPRPSSIVDANPGGKSIRRSDSWWARFASNSLLDRRHSNASQRSRPLDIRDPNPPPRLGAIEESMRSGSTPDDSPQSAQMSGGHGNDPVSRKKSTYGAAKHNKSLSSIQTSQTANSEALERMAGMDVAQRMGSGSHRTRSSLGSSFTAESGADDLLDMHHYESPIELTQNHTMLDSVASNLVSHPTAQVTSTSSPNNPPEPAHHSRKSLPDRTRSQSLVASRIAEFERRSSPQDETPSGPKITDGRPRKKSVTIGYGMVPKPSLFVANPDHVTSPFED